MKNLYTLALVILLANISNAQTLLFGGTNGNGDFENGSTGWVLVNGSQTNKWVVGNNATPGFTGSCVYISSGNSAPYPHEYSTNSSAYSYFYKDVPIPANAQTLWVTFDFICTGESQTSAFGTEAKDALRIWGRSTSAQVTAGQELDGVFISAAAGFYNQNSWKRKQVATVPVQGFAGSTMRLIFQWFNDGSNGNQPPAALDNIEFYASCQSFISPAPDFTLTATSTRLIWNTAAGASGYELRYKKIDEANTVPTYSNPINIAGGNTFNYTITGLAPASTYQAEIRPIGLACTEYGHPSVFSTLTPPANDSCNGAITLPVQSTAGNNTIASFRGSTPTSSLASICADGSKNDVWFKFVAQHTKQFIQTADNDFAESFYSAKNITLFEGACNNLQPVTQPCANSAFSVYQAGTVTRLIADGLTIGNTYYIRINTDNNDGYDQFSINVFNPMTAPDCPQLLQPTLDVVINYGIPYTFKWSKANGADAYRLRIIEQSGGYSEIYTRDTSYVFTPSAGINYTWIAAPFNVLDQSNGCTAATFSTCALIANPVIITAPDGNSKCGLDSVKLKASSGTNIQWFLNNTLIAGATTDSIWARQAGNYTVRVINGSCFSNASNIIAVSNLATPVKPAITAGGPISFCEGGSVTLTSSLNINNQWFNNGTAISSANGLSYNAVSNGQYYVRVTNGSSGCYNYSDTISINVTPLPTTPVISALTATNFCVGDSVKLKSSSVTGNKWYKDGVLIANAADSFYVAYSSGSYTVRVTVNNCTSLASVAQVVTANVAPATPPIVTSTGSLNFCVGDNVVQLSSSVALNNQWFRNGSIIAGATAATYQPTQSGDYTVKTNVANCYSAPSNSKIITVNPLPAKPVITANGYILSTGAGATSYTWFYNATAINGATTNQYAVLQAGLYRVMVADVNGCKNSSDDFNAVITGLNDVEVLGYKIFIFPNPATDYVTINVAPNNSLAKTFTATLSDMYGKTISVQKLKDGANKIHMTTLAQGHYFITIRNGNTVKTIKLMKTK